jgi:hypothetical protein
MSEWDFGSQVQTQRQAANCAWWKLARDTSNAQMEIGKMVGWWMDWMIINSRGFWWWDDWWDGWEMDEYLQYIKLLLLHHSPPIKLNITFLLAFSSKFMPSFFNVFFDIKYSYSY